MADTSNKTAVGDVSDALKSGSTRQISSALVNTASVLFDKAAEKLKPQSVPTIMDVMIKIRESDVCNFNMAMGQYMNRLMQININEKYTTLNALGSDAHLNGDSTSITSMELNPSYAKEINYLNFVRKTHDSELYGKYSTRRTVSDQKSPYDKTVNLYPDDLDRLPKKEDVWNAKDDKNSILYKTKRLFDGRKINTLISRFGTGADGLKNNLNYNGSARTKYGESHGRNLLKKGAEASGEKYMENGYNNPYCRVWTHHYKYDNYQKLIRPFITENNGVKTAKDLSDIHKWGNNFEARKVDKLTLGDKTSDKKYGWKSGNVGWDLSVLNTQKGGDGLVKITPKYLGGKSKNIHTKECMFSIENLAWRDYDPYSFEKALSWEQRGPLGGRIMWFPPYGIQFNESTNVNWSSNTFIGRGEDVYTYVNTQRSGTLSFLLVVDHPSIQDYVSWHDEGKVTDTDLMRFYAGCDPMDPNASDSNNFSILSQAKPTPLTDEYINLNLPTKETDAPPPPPTPPTPVPPPPPVVTTPQTESKSLEFVVLFPNNYSGLYEEKSDFFVKYLLFGKGAQIADHLTGETFEFDYENGIGYEMGGNGGISSVPEINNYNAPYPDGFENFIRRAEAKNYFAGATNPTTNITYYDNIGYLHRVDGFYANTYADLQGKIGEKSGYEHTKKYTIENNNVGNIEIKYSNTYDQKISDPERGKNEQDNSKNNRNYADLRSFGYNKSIVKELLTDKKTEKCSFARFVHDFTNDDGLRRGLDGKFDDNNDDAITLNENSEITKITITGISNSHGESRPDVVEQRNTALSVGRAYSIYRWLKECTSIKGKITDKTKIATKNISSVKKEFGIEVKGTDHDTEGAKLLRSAIVKIEWNVSKTTSATDAATSEVTTNTPTSNNEQYTDKEATQETGDNNNNNTSEGVNNEESQDGEQNQTVSSNGRRIQSLRVVDDGEDDTSDNTQNNEIVVKVDDDIKCKYDENGKRMYVYKNEEVKKINSGINNIVTIKSLVNINFDTDAKFRYQLYDSGSNIEIIGLKMRQDRYTVQSSVNVNINDKKDENWVELSKYNAFRVNSIENVTYANVTAKVVSEFVKGDTVEFLCDKNNNYVFRYNENESEYEVGYLKVEKNSKNELTGAKVYIKKLDGDSYTIDKDANKNEFTVEQLAKAGIVEYINKTPNECLCGVDKDSLSDKKITLLSNNETINVKVFEYNTDEYFEYYVQAKKFKKDKKYGYDIYEKNGKYYVNVFVFEKHDKFWTKVESEVKINTEGKCEINTGDIAKNITSPTKVRDVVTQNLKDGKMYRDSDGNILMSDGKGNIWTFGKDDITLYDIEGTNNKRAVIHRKNENNSIRYDQEYYFFKSLRENSPLVYERLMDKIKYFDPAFHSMTPEGFNARLTFLQQCTRQGNTRTASDDGRSLTATNLAFGRPPFCVLRIGDFYNQMIVIDSLSVDYSVSEGISWDLNPEGIGMQPMLARINISFKFIGGGDLAGPIRRLQNAMTFNYYANTRLYDNRADTVEYDWDDMVGGAMGHHKLKRDDNNNYSSGNYAYEAQYYSTMPQNAEGTPYKKLLDNTESLSQWQNTKGQGGFDPLPEGYYDNGGTSAQNTQNTANNGRKSGLQWNPFRKNKDNDEMYDYGGPSKEVNKSDKQNKKNNKKKKEQ